MTEEQRNKIINEEMDAYINTLRPGETTLALVFFIDQFKHKEGPYYKVCRLRAKRILLKLEEDNTLEKELSKFTSKEKIFLKRALNEFLKEELIEKVFYNLEGK